ncbi:hypothetical protein [Mycobacterium sp. BK086]|uniref:hypothetical protein n=1 Tax=Mycobacterium sp. BK086 TaxID=2512165 RepID=UPI002570F552|nr:hypothetical protein [Mycobacterium sp. BK086]
MECNARDVVGAVAAGAEDPLGRGARDTAARSHLRAAAVGAKGMGVLATVRQV